MEEAIPRTTVKCKRVCNSIFVKLHLCFHCFFISFISLRGCFHPPSLLSATIENDAAIQRAGRQTEREIHRQITRQIDQEVDELSMQRITAVTTCDHTRNERQGDRMRVTGGERERNR